MLDAEHSSVEVLADSAYRSEESEQLLEAQRYRNRIHEKAYSNRPLSKVQERTNIRCSRHCARIEHFFGAFTQQGGKKLRTIGKTRVVGKIGMMILL